MYLKVCVNNNSTNADKDAKMTETDLISLDLLFYLSSKTDQSPFPFPSPVFRISMKQAQQRIRRNQNAKGRKVLL